MDKPNNEQPTLHTQTKPVIDHTQNENIQNNQHDEVLELSENALNSIDSNIEEHANQSNDNSPWHDNSSSEQATDEISSIQESINEINSNKTYINNEPNSNNETKPRIRDSMAVFNDLLLKSSRGQVMTSSSLGAVHRVDSIRKSNSIRRSNLSFGRPSLDIEHSHLGTFFTALPYKQTIDPLVVYSTAKYSQFETKLKSDEHFITAANIALKPKHFRTNSTATFDSMATVSTVSPAEPTNHIKLGKPNQFRAFSRQSLSYSKRQWFTNICCISLCPVFIIIVSFAMQTLIQNLTLNGIDQDYQSLYCTNQSSINQQQWPIYNIKALGVQNFRASTYVGATKPVKHLNFLQRAIFVDLSSIDSLNVYSALSLTGSSPCANWFGSQYPKDNLDVYRLPLRINNAYATKDSLYAYELLNGWLDVLNIDPNAPDIYKRQANSLARSLATYQLRPWYVIGNYFVIFSWKPVY
jgi:hypothetical protein